MHVLREVPRSLLASPIFAFYVLLTLGVAGIIGLITIGVIDLGMTHFGESSHRTHDVTYGLLFTTGVVGMLSQLRHPEKNVAGMFMALIPVTGLALAAALSGDADAVLLYNPLRWAATMTVVAALLHPAGRGFFRSFSVSRVNWLMLALVCIATVALLALASTNIGLQESVPDMHGVMGHYGFMAAFSFTVIGVGMLASLRPDGWRLTAWAAGILPVLLAVTSMLYPDASSSLDAAWALAAAAWGVMFAATASLANPNDPARVGSRVASDSEHLLDV